jgi:murein DD-endopeptidase MepM/ murein hydrolase activator NlpD
MCLVRHADGTVARYLHLQTGSVTSKAIGATISRRARYWVGWVVPGISTGPHLHFELRANSTARRPPSSIRSNGELQRGGERLGQTQRPYRDSQLNRLSTHSAATADSPVARTLPTSPNFQDQLSTR